MFLKATGGVRRGTRARAGGQVTRGPQAPGTLYLHCAALSPNKKSRLQLPLCWALAGSPSSRGKAKAQGRPVGLGLGLGLIHGPGSFISLIPRGEGQSLRASRPPPPSQLCRVDTGSVSAMSPGTLCAGCHRVRPTNLLTHCPAHSHSPFPTTNRMERPANPKPASPPSPVDLVKSSPVRLSLP